MIITKMKPRNVTAEERQRAIDRVKDGAALREASAVAGL